MSGARTDRYLRIALRIVGGFAILAFYPLTVIWPSGWAWHGGQSEYLQMIIALYATLGVFLIIAARDPYRHLGVVSFGIWSSFVHATVMAVQAVANPAHIGHLVGDVPVLLVAGVALSVLCPAAFRLPFAPRSTDTTPP